MKYFFYPMIIMAVIITACMSPYHDGNDDGLPVKETPVIESDLFIPADTENEIRFYTNDGKYRRSTGLTLWTHRSDEPSADGSSEGTFSERTVTMRKNLGSNIAGYGLIICSAPRQVEDKMENVFLTIMINNNRQYAIGKVIGGSYTALVNWTEASGLIRGVGIENRVSIRGDTENSNKYLLFFNDVNDGFFVDEESPRCEGKGKNGYVVVIAPDDLNNSAVEVRFKEYP